MKRVLLISLAAAFCAAACGEKTNLQLKARELKEGQANTPSNPSKKAGGDSGNDGVQYLPTNTSNRKMLANGNAIRNIFIGSDAMTTTVLCTENLAKAQKENEKMKLQGQSQIIVRQVVTMDIPEAPTPAQNKSDKEAAKTLLRLSCLGHSADFSIEPTDENITLAKLTAGKSAAITGKFSSVVDDYVSTAVVACVTAKDMAKANSILLPDDKSKAVDILMAVNSKLLVETSSTDKDLKKYLVVTCDETSAE